ncbi:hypothetical protein E2C01_008699 [Portunus trituberculatus]|uniref:Uncharacterized protein n=1 Tax=Portunus trituberculatus TaxID=210409 RepID=A0A5B7D504_PORTR|nr:hypothetical protein [Portunus trituberculatus]
MFHHNDRREEIFSTAIITYWKGFQHCQCQPILTQPNLSLPFLSNVKQRNKTCSSS